MFELKTLVPKTHRSLLADSRSPGSQEPKQQRMMVIALTLLLAALGLVLYRDRDFWFPSTQEAQEVEDQPQQAVAAVASTARPALPATRAPAVHAKSHKSKPHQKASAPAVSSPAATPPDTPPVTATTTRTVLPPLEVEVVAGDVHRIVTPRTNSLRVDLQPGSPPQQLSEPPSAAANDATAAVTNNAAERVQMSTDTAEIVSRPVNPGYPLLARQMKVQGSVILQALIGRDGLIQDLRVLSGPPILASAAQEAVKQWHFKPHYQGADAVETLANITVNFTISTN